MLWPLPSSAVGVHIVGKKDKVPTLVLTNRTVSTTNMLTADQISQLSTPTYKARKEKQSEKLAASPSLVDAGSVILGQLDKSSSVVDKEVQPLTEKKSTPSKDKKSTSSKQSTSFKEYLEAFGQ